MDRDRFIESLNEDLQTEFQSVVQYVQHTATITGPEYLSTVDELKVHLGQELQHAQILAEQIAFLGGVPTTRVPDVPEWTNSKEALRADLRLENGQLGGTVSALPRRTSLASLTSPRPYDRCSSKPKNMFATCKVLSVNNGPWSRCWAGAS